MVNNSIKISEVIVRKALLKVRKYSVIPIVIVGIAVNTLRDLLTANPCQGGFVQIPEEMVLIIQILISRRESKCFIGSFNLPEPQRTLSPLVNTLLL